MVPRFFAAACTRAGVEELSEKDVVRTSIQHPSQRTARTERGTAGFTLVELMVAIGVLLVASMAAFSSQLASLNLMKTSRETDTAMAELQSAMEQVLAKPLAVLAEADGDAELPDGAQLADFNDRNLTDERMVVTYPGYTGGDVPDPLTITLTVSWSDFQGRSRSLELTSMKSQ